MSKDIAFKSQVELERLLADKEGERKEIEEGIAWLDDCCPYDEAMMKHEIWRLEKVEREIKSLRILLELDIG